MIKSKRYILFLNNKYKSKDNAFYLDIIKSKVTVAVDGGIRFFRKNRIRPNIFIGDFDSTPRLSENYLKGIEIVKHPVKKDKTDSQLAVELVLTRGANNIEICNALSVSEIDHTLGNIFLLELINKFKAKSKAKISASLIDPRKRIFLINKESIKISGKPGNYISFIPLSNKGNLEFAGLSYPPPSNKKISIGDTLTLRNQFKNKTATIKTTGKFLVIVYSEDFKFADSIS